MRRFFPPGGYLDYQGNFISRELADKLQRYLQDNISWEQEYIYGRPVPRLTAWIAEPGTNYRYSGTNHLGRGIPEPLQKLLELTNQHTKKPEPLNSIVLNLYRNGQDSMGMHADDEQELGLNPTIYSILLGATRNFVLQSKADRRDRFIQPLEHGSLAVMSGDLQHHWLHGIPRQPDVTKPHINLTLRTTYR